VYEGKDINRSEITQSTGLTNAAVSIIINSLIGEKFLVEKSYYSEWRKRKNRYLAASEGVWGVAVFYFGRQGTTAALLDISGRILYEQRYPLSYYQLDAEVLEKLAQAAFSRLPAGLSCLGAVIVTSGIACVDSQAASQREIEMLKEVGAPYYWDFREFGGILRDRYHIPVWTENDSNAALLGEKWFGKGKEVDNLVLYSIGKGIGSGVYANGRLLRHERGAAIEIGHVSINYRGDNCSCGNRGCLELYAGLDNWETRLGRVRAFAGKKHKTHAMFAGALRGDALCEHLLEKYCRLAAEGGITLAGLFSPDKIIVTTNEADLIYLKPIIDVLKEEIKTRIFHTRRTEIDVEESELRGRGILLGGIATALERTLLEG
jgi:predicted NBD/HSP70 family sugar kinase